LIDSAHPAADAETGRNMNMVAKPVEMVNGRSEKQARP
jgi:hypothetical protein